tara:strand:+ start:86 stop:682 length:597 start_codon:yes stop_codon:yes gene_type:complete
MSQNKLDGIFFVTRTIDNFEYIEFHKNGNFEHKKGGHLGNPEPSRGNYEIKSKQIILNFNNSQSKKLGFHKTEIWRNMKDSINLNFKIMDLNGNPLEHAWIVEDNRKNSIKSDKNGNGILKLKKANNFINFKITWIGFQYYDLRIDKNYNQNIYIYLTEDLQEIPIRNQIDTLKIKELKKDYFITEKNIKWEKAEQEY